MEKIKVLEVIRQGLIGGGESHVIDVVKYLDRSVFEPVVLSFTDGPMVEEIQRLGAKVFVIPTLKPFDRKVWKEVGLLLQQEEIDIIHAHGTRAQSNVFWSAYRKNVPLIYTVHGWSFHDDQPPLLKGIRQQSERVMVWFSDQVINVSASNRQTGLRKLGKFKSRVINNGIDLEKFDFQISNSGLKKSLGIPGSRVVAGCIMRLTHQKNPLGMLRAFHQCLKSADNLHLLLVGDGDQMEDVRSEVLKLGLMDRVTLAGNRKDVPDLLSVIDIFCLPSLWEGLSLGLLEAMAMKKAIIATRVDGTREVMKNRGNGLLVPSGNETMLANSLVELSKNPELRMNLGEAAYLTVKKSHEVRQMVDAIEEEYLKLIQLDDRKTSADTLVHEGS